MELVKTSNLKKYYRTGEICIKALDHVNLSVEEVHLAEYDGRFGYTDFR